MNNVILFEPKKISELFNGVQNIYEFANGYGASVIKHDFSYGSDLGLWEIAVLDSSGNVDSTTKITDDVLGWIATNNVQQVLEDISKLERK
jgi:hypothetical protein